MWEKRGNTAGNSRKSGRERIDKEIFSMDIFGVLSLIGGLALFLYGMTTMGDGLVRLSGGRLEKILEKLTQNRLMALLLGVFVTAVIQSSSATTVMVVGFVNSGIMNLNQAVGVIMGANIGTTVTSWILSLTGISSSNIFLSLLKPSSFTPVLAAIGIIFLMGSKDGSKKKNIGTILLGFAVLMFGMEAMSSSVAPLTDDAAFTGMLTHFSNPFLGLIVGALLTAIIQSSSASVGILQALCISGVVSYGTAIPIIMGQNIGTCVTAMISSVGASKNAKRAAFIHLYFNMIGTAIFMIVFYSINHFVHFSFLTEEASAAGIAVIHSLFNIGACLVLFPFADGLVKLATLTVRDSKKEEEKKEENPALAALDERFLDRPAFAIQLCKEACDEMGRISKKAMLLAMQTTNDYSEEKVQEVIELEEQADHFEDVLGTYLVKLSGRDLTTKDSQLLSIMLHCLSDFERISDHAINITDAVTSLHEQGLTMSDQGQVELNSLGVAVRDILDLTVNVFLENDIKHASDVEPLEEVIDDLVMEMKQRHIMRLRSGVCSMEAGLLLEDILTNYERVSDHCSNVAVTVIEIQSGEMDTHEYLNQHVKTGDQHFKDEYMRLKRIYILP